MKKMLLATLFSFAATLAAVMAHSAPLSQGGKYVPISLEAGTWDADITFFDENFKPQPRHAHGVQINVPLRNGHWISNVFTIDGMPYEGHGVWGYDPVAKTYVDTWVDTNDYGVRTDYGYWDGPTQTLYWSSKQNDGAGHFIDYRIVEEFRGKTRTFTQYILSLRTPGDSQAKGLTPHPLVRIVFHKRT